MLEYCFFFKNYASQPEGSDEAQGGYQTYYSLEQIFSL